MAAGPFASGPTDRERRNASARRRARTSDGRRTGASLKLSAEDCVEIRRMSAAFKTQREIATRFGVGTEVVRRVLRGEYGEAS